MTIDVSSLASWMSGRKQRSLNAAADRSRDRREWSRAAELYQQYLKINPRHQAIWVQLGNCSKEAGDLDAALDAYNTASGLDSDDHDVFLQLGHLYKNLGLLTEAEQAYKRSYLLKKDNNSAKTELKTLGANLLDMDGSRFPRLPDHDGRTIYVDVTDLFEYLSVNVSLSGIQRVVCNVLMNADTFISAHPDVKIVAVLPNYEGERIFAIDSKSLRALMIVVIEEGARRKDIDAAIVACLTSRQRASPKDGDTLLIAGAFWILRRYDLFVQLRLRGVRVVLFVHDLIQITNPEYVEPAATETFRRSLVDMVCVSSLVLTNSKFVAAEVQRFIDFRMHFSLPVVPITLATELPVNGQGAAHNVSDDVALVAKGDYVLCVGTIEIRKNHLYLIKVWARLIASGAVKVPDLVLVGKWGWEIDDLRKYLDGSDWLGGRLYIFNAINDSELSLLYERCLFTIYPSFAEGWGLPVGESLANGKFCIASNTTSIPEVGGDFCKYIDPFDIEDGFATIQRILLSRGDIAALNDRVAQEFTPKTWIEFSVQIFTAIDEHARDPRAAASGLNCIIDPGEVAYFGDDALPRLYDGPHKLATARMARIEGWHGLEGWGCWARRRRAKLLLSVPLRPGTAVVVMVWVKTPETDKMADCTIVIEGIETSLEGLTPIPEWRAANGRVSTNGCIELLLIGGKGFHHGTGRETYVGLMGVSYFERGDRASKNRFLSHVAPVDLDDVALVAHDAPMSAVSSLSAR